MQLDAFQTDVVGWTSSTATARRRRVEAGVQQRIDSTVNQGHRLGYHVDDLRHLVAIFGPDVNEVNGEIRRPAGDERADDAQSHLDRSHTSA